MTAHATHPASSSSSEGPDPVFGRALVALNPLDGLFLRAEHLSTIQRYAKALATAVGRAGGAGVVHGYTARVSGGDLNVGSGLAFPPTGQPLLLDQPVSVKLPAPGTAGAGSAVSRGTWIVEILAGTTPTEQSEQVFGLLCDDPCTPDQQFRPYLVDGVRVRIRPISLDLRSWTGRQFRSAVASAYFEKERTAVPSLIPTSERATTQRAELASPTWSTATGLPDGEGVPIGLLLLEDSGWTLDVWAARRDGTETPSERSWAQRTGRRPWGLFIAQVLQFQAHLADRNVAAAMRSRKAASVTLEQEGFVELPPAGYLPFDPSSGESVIDQVTRLMGPGVDLRFCSARPDETGLALERAQHLDRIPLVAAGPEIGATHPQVDIIVPGGEVTQARRSPAWFGGGTVTLRDPRGGSANDRTFTGLARVEHRRGGPATLAFAGATSTALRRADDDAVWFAMELGRSPFDIRRKGVTSILVTAAGFQAGVSAPVIVRGAVTWHEVAHGTDGVLLRLSGRFTGEAGGSAPDGPVSAPVNLVVGLEVRLLSSGGHVLQLDLSEGKGRLSLIAEVETSEGRWELSLRRGPTNDGDGDSDGDGDGDSDGDGDNEQILESDLDGLQPDEVATSAARFDADRALTALAEHVPIADAVRLLFAGAVPASAIPSYTTAHDWVLFTRRHTLTCNVPTAPSGDVAVDLYLRLPERDATERSAEPSRHRWIAELRWNPKTQRLANHSADALRAWRDANGVIQPASGELWTDDVTLELRPLVDRVVASLASPRGTQATRVDIPPVAVRPGITAVVVIVPGEGGDPTG